MARLSSEGGKNETDSDKRLENQTSLEPKELMTDTAGYSDIVFGLFWLLGFQFSPRLAYIGELRFWRLDCAAIHRDISKCE